MRGLTFPFSLWLVTCLAGTITAADPAPKQAAYVVVLGVAQDAGYPQAGCRRACCQAVWQAPDKSKQVACLAIVDPKDGERWLLDCTPDFRQQLRRLDELAPNPNSPGLNGILLTHAHMGHYTGLLHLGREAMGARGVPVYAMPRMRQFLLTQGPWEQLAKLQQIDVRKLAAGHALQLNARIQIVPFLVPHRDEYSETVGFRIQGPSRTIIYLPDIDKWERWQVRIEDVLATADVAYLDGTFFDGNELPGRDMSQIPHPFIVESMRRFRALPLKERNKIRFIHANHTNPILTPDSPARAAVQAAGHHVAEQGERFGL